SPAGVGGKEGAARGREQRVVAASAARGDRQPRLLRTGQAERAPVPALAAFRIDEEARDALERDAQRLQGEAEGLLRRSRPQRQVHAGAVKDERQILAAALLEGKPDLARDGGAEGLAPERVGRFEDGEIG